MKVEMNSQKFRRMVKQIQRNQYFHVQLFSGDDEVIILEEPELLTALTRSITMEKQKQLDWTLLGISEKYFWRFIESLTTDDPKTKLRLSYLDPNGEVVGGMEYIGIKVEDVMLNQNAANQVGGEICMVTLNVSYKGQKVFCVND
jgi:hypothetical protein